MLEGARAHNVVEIMARLGLVGGGRNHTEVIKQHVLYFCPAPTHSIGSNMARDFSCLP